MSQRELAERIGVQRNTVARWEMDETEDAKNSIRPGGPARQLLGLIFGIDPNAIEYGAGTSSEALGVDPVAIDEVRAVIKGEAGTE